MEPDFSTLDEEREYLSGLVSEWNENRLDMFALTQPNEDLEFHGVMRFYFQDAGSKVATKCIRVSSSSTVSEVMETLIEKFNPDMKMLSTPHYELYEIHGNNDTRKIGREEKPLFVQLGWHKDNREGRFLLKSADVKIPTTFFELHKDETQLKRRLSRREKKELKKKRKEESTKGKDGEEKAIAENLYNELPETMLTRSISNPEAVMRRRRQQKLEKRLKEFQSSDGQQTGGILKIFAEKLKPEIPYKTILVALNDTTDLIVQDALDKFLLEKEDPTHYCLVMAMTMIPPDKVAEQGKVGKERVLRDDDCPLAIQNSWPPSRGIMTFHLRKKENITGASTTKDKKLTPQKSLDKSIDKTPGNDRLPYFLELSPDGREINYRPKIHEILPNVTNVGSKKTPGPNEQYLQLFSSRMLAQHCVVANMGGVVTITPSRADADVHVDGQLISETTLLKHGAVVQFGNVHTFKYCDPNSVDHNSSLGRDKKGNDGQIRTPQEPPPRTSKGRPVSAGTNEMSPSVSPMLKELILNEQVGSKVDDDLVIETTFGVDGIVETSPVKRDFGQISKGFQSSTDVREVEKQLERKGLDRNMQKSAPNLLAYNQQLHYRDEPQLPASLTFLEQGAFFAAIISEVNGAAVHFKLAPTYTLYLACRYLQSGRYRPELNPDERKQLISQTAKRIALTMQSTMQENEGLAGSLAFWIANASELLHFLKQDVDLSHPSQSTQSILAHTVQQGFRLLVAAMQEELSLALPAFLDPSEEVDIHPRDLDGILNDDQMERAESIELLNWTSDDRTFRVKHPMGPNGRPVSGEQWISPAARISLHGCPVLSDLLYILSSAMSLLRRCRVNAALTIQLFSQLFHYINMWLFNKIILEPRLGLCTKQWGIKLRRRLGYVEAWAERQGLELAADCHLCRVIQAAHLLQAPKSTPNDIASISSTCFKLNSLQLRALLKRYRPDRTENIIQEDLIESVVTVAEDTADELARSDGREVKLAEDEELMLPFLLPEDGYSCDIIRGVPTGLQEFLEPLIDTELCTLSINPLASGLWTVYQQPYQAIDGQSRHRMSPVPPDFYDAPEVTTMTIQKGNGGLGLSIVAAKGGNSEHLGIYIKAVVPGGAADRDGRLEAGDQLIAVNGNSLIGVSQERAAGYMGQSGATVTLDVCKHAAVYHGLATLLNQSPGPGSDVSRNSSQRINSYEGSNSERSPNAYDNGPQNARQWATQSPARYSEDDEMERRRREQIRQEEYERRMEEDRFRHEQAMAAEAEAEEAKRQVQAARRRAYEEEMYRQEEDMFNNKNEEQARKHAEKERRRLILEEEDRRRAEEERRQIEAEKERRRKDVEDKERQRIEEEKRLQEEEEKRRLEEEQIMQQLEDEEKRRQEDAERERQREIEERDRQRLEEEKRRIEEDKIRADAEYRQKEAARVQLEIEQRRKDAERRQRETEERQRAAEEKRNAEAKQQQLEQDRREREAEQRRIEEAEKRRVEEAEKRRKELEQRQKEILQRQHVEEERRRIAEEQRRKTAEETRARELEFQRNHKQQNPPSVQQTVRSTITSVTTTNVNNRTQAKGGDLRDFVQELSLDLDDTFDATDPLDLPPPPEDLLEDPPSGNSPQPRASPSNRSQSPRRVFTGETNIDDVDASRLAPSSQFNASSNEQRRHVFKLDLGTSPRDANVTSSSSTDLEAEFQRRLEEDRARKAVEARQTKFVEDEIDYKKQLVRREYEEEEERRQQIVLTERERFKTQQGIGIDRQMKDLNISNTGYNTNDSQQNDWMTQQRNLRARQREDQERLRRQQREQEEADQRRRYQQVQQRREQQEQTLQEYEKHKRQSGSDFIRAGSVSPNDAVRAEFRIKATSDYQKRRETIDRDIEQKQNEFKRVTAVSYSRPKVSSVSSQPHEDDDDEPPPPRPPPPAAFKPATSSARSSPSPYNQRDGGQYRSSSTTSVPQTYRSTATYRAVAPPVLNGAKNNTGVTNYQERKNYYSSQS